MAIFLILSTVGITAFIGARDRSIVSEAAEKYLALVREAQNRSISVTKGDRIISDPTEDTIGWGAQVDLSNGLIDLVHLDVLENTTTEAKVYTQGQSVNEDSKVRVESSYVQYGGTVNIDTTYRYIFFSSPFARTYTSIDSCTSGAAGACSWSQSGRPTKDWEISLGSGFSDPRDLIKVKFTYKNHEQTVVINSKGDAYIEY